MNQGYWNAIGEGIGSVENQSIHILTLLNLELLIKLRYIRSHASADFDISGTILLTYIVAGIYSLGKIRYKRYFDISGIRYIRFHASADFDISDTILLTYIVAGIGNLGKFRYVQYFDIFSILYIRFTLYMCIES